MSDKVELVEKHKDKYGLNMCCRALGLSKGTLAYRRDRASCSQADEQIKAEIVTTIRHHPEYGYRRIKEDIKARTGIVVNHKRLRKILSTYELDLPRHLPKRGKNPVLKLIKEVGQDANLVQNRTVDPLCVFCTDFTELRYCQGQKKAWLMAFLDIHTRWIAGFGVGAHRNRDLAIYCLDQLQNNLSCLDRRLSDILIHHDRDSVYTSYDWLHRVLITEGAGISFAMNGAKDNPWIESFWGRFKTESKTLIMHADSLTELICVTEQQMTYYNQDRRHSALNYRTPQQVVQAILMRNITTDP